MTTAGRKCARPGCSRTAFHSANARGLCYQHAHAAGTFDTRIPADRVRDHLRTVTSQGATIDGIAAGCGVGAGTVWRILDGRQQLVTRSRHHRLMRATPDMRMLVPSLGTVRRLQALRTAGWQVKDLAAALDVTGQTIINRTSQDHLLDAPVPAALAARTREFFDAHQEVIAPPSSKVATKMWALPADWDDPDNPDEYHFRRKARTAA